MCTALTFQNAENQYFGRNLDLDYDFGQQVVITPRNYPLKFNKVKKTLKEHFAMIGMATIISNYPLYAEAMNEKGLAMAGLNFPNYSNYSKGEKAEHHNIAPYEIIPWVLSQFITISEVKKAFKKLNVIDIPFNENIPNTTLHWIIADKNNNSIVLESTMGGIKITDNPVGVLTNSPTIDFHLTSLQNYIGLSSKQPNNTLSTNMDLKSFGQGLGAFGLPGDYSPNSRFIKTVFLKENSLTTNKNDDLSNITQVFHILDAVSMIKGTVVTPQNEHETTLYSCCMNVVTGDFYYKTYNNNQISVVYLNKEDLNTDTLIYYPLQTQQQLYSIN